MISIRKATINDASFIALAIAEALGDDIMLRNATSICPADEHRLRLLTDVARADATLYSWRHTLIAQDSHGTPVGALVAYPGDDYITMRNHTFEMLSELISFDISAMDAETLPGEYYVDSIAVLPQYRKQGIATLLLQAGIQEAKLLQRPVILACAPDNLGAMQLYQSLGFSHQGNLFIFGHHYLRMVVQ